MADAADNSLMLEILKEIRKEQRDQRSLLLLVSERVDKLDRLFDKRFQGVELRIGAVDQRIGAVDQRIGGLEHRMGAMEVRMGGMTDDLEMMLKSELMGSLGNFETRMMNLIEERLVARGL